MYLKEYYASIKSCVFLTSFHEYVVGVILLNNTFIMF